MTWSTPTTCDTTHPTGFYRPTLSPPRGRGPRGRGQEAGTDRPPLVPGVGVIGRITVGGGPRPGVSTYRDGEDDSGRRRGPRGAPCGPWRTDVPVHSQLRVDLTGSSRAQAQAGHGPLRRGTREVTDGPPNPPSKHPSTPRLSPGSRGPSRGVPGPPRPPGLRGVCPT